MRVKYYSFLSGPIVVFQTFQYLFSAFSLIIKWAKSLSVDHLHIGDGLSMAKKGLQRTVLDSSGNSGLLNITQNRPSHSCLAEAETVSFLSTNLIEI